MGKPGWIAIAVFAGSFALGGCRIHESKGDGGKDVEISTPIGGLHIVKGHAATAEELGVAQYPGSVLTGDRNSDKSADVDVHAGDFAMKLRTASFRTLDDEEKVQTFYRKALSQYGDVIACRGQQTVGSPARTGMGLTCSDDRKHVGSPMNMSDRDIELKAGSKRRQHIVAVERKNGGTEIRVVALELSGEPGND